MVFRRARVTRFVAAILAIALSTQIAGAQVVNCMKMSASHGISDHSGMTHHTGADGVKAGNGASHTQTPGSTGCSQTTLCMNTPAVLNVALRAAQVSRVASPISFVPTTLEARALRPDSPPPKI